MNLQEKCSKIKAVILDVDGVLTDGRIGYRGDSEEDLKFYDVRDGHGIKLALRCGLKVGILSGRQSGANRKRAQELELTFIYESVKNKGEGLQTLLAEHDLTPEECMYIGDDVVDIPPMKRCGFSVAVANGVEELDLVADYRTRNNGGKGAVREAIELLLKEQGKWDGIIQRYLA